MGVTFSSSGSNSGDSRFAAGKNVLITGASAGIGAELARKFARQGANLALVARNRTKLEAVAEECRQAGGATAVGVFPCDLTKDEDTRETVQKITDAFEGGTIDIVVLNAGRSMGCYFEEITDIEAINYMLKLNVNGVLHALLCALPAMPKAGASRIVVVSSVAGVLGVPYRTIYCASKHALGGFCNALRIELRDTYGADSPRVQLITFPEVRGTDLNAGRMGMGALRPPVEFRITPRVTTVETACAGLMREIERGTDEWGQSRMFAMVAVLRLFFARLADFLILRGVQKSHIRSDERTDESPTTTTPSDKKSH